MRTETSRQTVAWFAKRAAEDVLHLAPPFQRNPVWQDRERAYLVDTVIKQLPIPEIYVHVETSPKGTTHYTVVDGQQRTRALLDFVGDKYGLEAEFTPEWGERKFSDLPPDLQQRIWAYSLVVRELHEASEADVRGLFERLNRFVFALNAQELRNARYKGEFLQTVYELADDEFWATNRIVTPKDIRRMQDAQFVSELLIGLVVGVQHKTETIDDYYEMYDATFPERAQWTKHFYAVQELFLELVPDLPHSHWRKKSSFYSLFLVLGEVQRRKVTRDLDFDKVRRLLASFGEMVESALSKEPPKDLPGEAVAYAIAVGRAASDRDRRLERLRILQYVIGLRDSYKPDAPQETPPG